MNTQKQTKIIVAYHSGYGHTKRQAQAVVNGINNVGSIGSLLDVSTIENIEHEAWEELANSDGIIFGSPTYMGGVSAQFKKFADLSSKAWFMGKWKNKIAGGFTNSASTNGDKHSSIQYLWTLAMQHGMIWVGTGLPPASAKSNVRGDVNYLGGFAGALAVSPSDSTTEEAPHEGDLKTAEIYGERLAKITQSINL